MVAVDHEYNKCRSVYTYDLFTDPHNKIYER